MPGGKHEASTSGPEAESIAKRQKKDAQRSSKAKKEPAARADMTGGQASASDGQTTRWIF